MAEEGPDLEKHADSLLCSMCLICIETGHDAVSLAFECDITPLMFLNKMNAFPNLTMSIFF
jgi:hypothetical protein